MDGRLSVAGFMLAILTLGVLVDGAAAQDVTGAACLSRYVPFRSAGWRHLRRRQQDPCGRLVHGKTSKSRVPRLWT